MCWFQSETCIRRSQTTNYITSTGTDKFQNIWNQAAEHICDWQ